MPALGRVYLAIIGTDVSDVLASTILKVRLDLEGQKDMRIVLYDNGSSDDSADIALMTNVTVKRYNKKKDIGKIMENAIDDAVRYDSNVNLFLDLSGDNDADDVISLVRASDIQGPQFAGGWINPRNPNGRIGCLGLDRHNLLMLSESKGDLEVFIEKMLSSKEYRKNMYKEIIEKRTKMKEMNRRRFDPRFILRVFRRNHPLTFYGSFGLISVLGAMATGFYTVDYFYKNQNLYYPTAFSAVLLTMIGGFFLVAGLMLNAMNVVEERVRAMKRWESASEEFRW